VLLKSRFKNTISIYEKQIKRRKGYPDYHNKDKVFKNRDKKISVKRGKLKTGKRRKKEMEGYYPSLTRPKAGNESAQTDSIFFE
jgi:hypothetical protein